MENIRLVGTRSARIAVAIFCFAVSGFAPAASAQIFLTVGVYDENNGVNFVADGSTLNFPQFKSDVAAAFTNDFGGVNQCYGIGAAGGPYNFAYGLSISKELTMKGGTNNQIGVTAGNPYVQPISGNSLWVSETPGMTFFMTNIAWGAPNEAVTQFGLTILSTSYFTVGDVTATARFSGGGVATAHRTINEGAGAGNTFFGFAAPRAQSIVSVTFTNSAGQNMFLDDIGFITSATPVLRILRLGNSRTQITWPTNFTTFSLEFSTNLTAPVWTADTNAQTVIGDQVTVTVDSTRGQRVYRLRKP